MEWLDVHVRHWCAYQHQLVLKTGSRARNPKLFDGNKKKGRHPHPCRCQPHYTTKGQCLSTRPSLLILILPPELLRQRQQLLKPRKSFFLHLTTIIHLPVMPQPVHIRATLLIVILRRVTPVLVDKLNNSVVFLNPSLLLRHIRVNSCNSCSLFTLLFEHTLILPLLRPAFAPPARGKKQVAESLPHRIQYSFDSCHSCSPKLLKPLNFLNHLTLKPLKPLNHQP